MAVNPFGHTLDQIKVLTRPVRTRARGTNTLAHGNREENKGNRESLFEHCLGDGGTQSKTVLIYDPDTIDSEVKSICDSKRWECVSKTEAVGTEFSRVIIYGLKEFHFEAFTRAVNQLIIVTTSPYVSVF